MKGALYMSMEAMQLVAQAATTTGLHNMTGNPQCPSPLFPVRIRSITLSRHLRHSSDCHHVQYVCSKICSCNIRAHNE